MMRRIIPARASQRKDSNGSCRWEADRFQFSTRYAVIIGSGILTVAVMLWNVFGWLTVLCS